MHLETLRAIAGIGVYPALSLVLFVLAFAVIVWRVVRMDGADVRRLAALPFDSPADEAAPSQETVR